MSVMLAEDTGYPTGISVPELNIEIAHYRLHPVRPCCVAVGMNTAEL